MWDLGLYGGGGPLGLDSKAFMRGKSFAVAAASTRESFKDSVQSAALFTDENHRRQERAVRRDTHNFHTQGVTSKGFRVDD